jgi:hypothetical protein
MINIKHEILSDVFHPLLVYLEDKHISFILLMVVPYLLVCIPIMKSKRNDEKIQLLKIILILTLLLMIVAGVREQIVLLE